jgi:hypothetical protein
MQTSISKNANFISIRNTHRSMGRGTYVLLLKAEIMFLDSGLSHNISTKIINRPGINLGNNLIFQA